MPDYTSTQLMELRRSIAALRDELAKYKKAQPAATQTASTKPAPIFNPEEQRTLARFGLEPGQLRGLAALSDIYKGVTLRNKLVDQALSGKINTPAPSVLSKEELAPYA